MTLLGIGKQQTTGYIQNRKKYQSQCKTDIDTFKSKAVAMETYNVQDRSSLSIKPGSIEYLASFFGNATPVKEIPEDHFTESSEYEKMVDSTTGVTYYKNKTKPEIQMTPGQAAKFYEFFGDDTMSAINLQRELSGTRKVYGDYTIELLGTTFNRAAIINHKDNSISEFNISGDPNDLFNEIDKFLDGRKLSFELFAEFLGNLKMIRELP